MGSSGVQVPPSQSHLIRTRGISSMDKCSLLSALGKMVELSCIDGLWL